MGYAVLHMEKTSGTDAAMSAHIERIIKPKDADEFNIDERRVYENIGNTGKDTK